MVKRVLIVEDEQDVADLVAEVLSGEGFETQVTLGGTAFQQALSFEPDVVLLDLMMPLIDGFEVARQLRAHEATRGVPIVVMTAMHDAVTHASRVGASRILAKPFDIGLLIETVEGLSS